MRLPSVLIDEVVLGQRDDVICGGHAQAEQGRHRVIARRDLVDAVEALEVLLGRLGVGGAHACGGAGVGREEP